MKRAREKAESVWIWHASLHSEEGGPPGWLRSAHLGNEWPCWPRWARERYWSTQTKSRGTSGHLAHHMKRENSALRSRKKRKEKKKKRLSSSGSDRESTNKQEGVSLQGAEGQRRGRHLWFLRPSAFTSGSDLCYRPPRTMLESGLSRHRVSNKFRGVGSQSWEGWREDGDRQ